MPKLPETSKYLASTALNGSLIHYSNMADALGLGSAQNCTSPLQEVMRWCNKNDLPDLSVIVISKSDKTPTWHAENLKWSEAKIRAEQARVFEFDWSKVFRSLRTMD